LRLSVTILLLILLAAPQNSVASRQPCITITIPTLTCEINSTINGLCSTTAQSTSKEEFSKNIQSVLSPILLTSSWFSFNSGVEVRHLLAAFFISLIVYFTSNCHNAKHYYLDTVFATRQRLKLIYPHHSFW
jgi:hypothetical protein